jgi:hypothetical protein
MKPDWKDAPEWAQHLAMDENGTWYWFSREPRIDEHPIFGGLKWDSSLPGKCEEAIVPGWRDTLEKRP